MLFEGAVSVIIKKHNGDYGLQKLFSMFASVIFSHLEGKSIDVRDDDDYTYVIAMTTITRTSSCSIAASESSSPSCGLRVVKKLLLDMVMTTSILNLVLCNAKWYIPKYDWNFAFYSRQTETLSGMHDIDFNISRVISSHVNAIQTHVYIFRPLK